MGQQFVNFNVLFGEFQTCNYTDLKNKELKNRGMSKNQCYSLTILAQCVSMFRWMNCSLCVKTLHDV